MTNIGHKSGTDRLAEAAGKLGLSDDDIVVNVQGDQPLFAPAILAEVVQPLLDEPELPMATLVYRITRPEEITNPNHVKTVFDRRGRTLGLVRRVSTWDNPETLHVHPRTVRVPFEATGFQLDVEGVVTAKLSSSDVAFHALRDYEPGDDRRHVHWASSARLGRLVVRQFEETRRSHHLLVLDTRSGAWPREDFETTSWALSLAVLSLLRYW